VNNPNIDHSEGQLPGGRQTPFNSDRYLKIVYSEERRPKSEYNFKLARHLTECHFGGPGRLLDIGCGRGDMLRGFASTGHQVSGVDISPDVEEYCQPFEAKVVDLEVERAPYPKNSFDFVFSKSVIEHMRDPMQLLGKAYELLAPGGIAIIMTPSWLHHRWGPFYLDYTHVTPFTAPSLSDAMEFAGFESVEVTHFRQLPFLWSYPSLFVPMWMFSKLPLPYEPMYQMTVRWPIWFNKIIRFSKEAMLLGVGRKAS
tara:strand:- start:3423 stop:4190 length:768 start_codon:yes stop_codon:yes gene_type:complete